MSNYSSGGMRFEALDGWRGIAALLVVFHHLPVFSHLFGTPLIDNSYLAVDFFFVLSGFVLTHAYGGRLKSGIDLPPFVVQRFGRLWPLQAFTLLLMIVLELGKLFGSELLGIALDRQPFTGSNSSYAVGTNLLLLQGIGIHSSTTWNWPSWSISVEFYTYIVFALVCLLPKARPIVAAIICAASALMLFRYSNHRMNVTYDLGFFRCLLGFFVGVITYDIFRLKLASWRRSPLKMSIAEVLATVGVGIYLWTVGDSVWGFVAPMVFALAVLVFSLGEGVISVSLRSRPIQFLGVTSFSIYLLHAPLIVALGVLAELAEALTGGDFTVQVTGRDGLVRSIIETGSYWANDLISVLFVVVLLLAAYLTYRFIEVPGKDMFYGVARSYRARSRVKA